MVNSVRNFFIKASCQIGTVFTFLVLFSAMGFLKSASLPHRMYNRLLLNDGNRKGTTQGYYEILSLLSHRIDVATVSSRTKDRDSQQYYVPSSLREYKKRILDICPHNLLKSSCRQCTVDDNKLFRIRPIYSIYQYSTHNPKRHDL